MLPSGSLVLTVAAALLFGPAASSASAAEPPELWTRCESGTAAGNCNIPRGIAADPRDGHVFVADQNNRRIDEFNALGQFVKTWGWDVVESGPDNTGTGFEICGQANVDVCKAGVSGSGQGQFSAPEGVAVDSSGDVYVVDFSNRRVEKFDRNGNFLLMFGGNVNKTKVEAAAPEAQRNLCPVDPGDVCQAGTTGTGNGQFGAWKVGSFIAIDPTDKVYVGDVNRIQRFDTGGHYQGELQLPATTVQGLAADASGNLYAIYDGKPGVHKLQPSEPTPTVLAPAAGYEVKTPDGEHAFQPTAVAVDSAGHVYAFGPTVFESRELDPIFEFEPGGELIANFGKEQFSGASTGLAANLCAGSEAPGNLYASNPSSGNAFVRAYGTNPIGCFRARTLPATEVEETTVRLNGNVNPKGEAVSECFFQYGETTSYGQTAPCSEPDAAEIGTGSTPVPVHAAVGSLAAGTVYHFRLIAKVGGETETGADEEFKTKGPPVISEDFTASVTQSEATLRALVNPEGFSTSYRFEYGLTAAYGQSTPSITIGSDRTDHPVVADLAGLRPATAYHWRIVAANSSSEKAGHPSEGEDHVFTTYSEAALESDCPNQAFRIATSAFLPDCRAYEMVSPVDKNGGDIVVAGPEGANRPGGIVQAAPDGNRITYTSEGSAFGDAPNHFAYNQYLASRHERGEAEEGWTNHGIHPPDPGRKAEEVPFFGVFRDFIAFSPDLCDAWLLDTQTPPLTPDGQLNRVNLYRQENCGAEAGGLEALTPTPPALPAETPEHYATNESVQGVSADSRHAVFVANAPLTSDAGSDFRTRIYDRFGGANHLVSVLPSGSADPSGAEVGSSWSRNLDHAVSSDGSRVYWSSEINQGIGKIFLREHPEREQSAISGGKCSEAAKACTVRVSANLTTPLESPNEGFFWSAAADGSKALYSEGDLLNGKADLYEFDLGRLEAGEAASRRIASDVSGVAGAADDLSRVYFVSGEALNDEEEGEEEGKFNLYLEEAGGFSFIATLAKGDLGIAPDGDHNGPYSAVAATGYLRAARVTPDGAHIAFESLAPLSGADNTDAATGEADVEVFTYQAGGPLLCVSCNPSGARPKGQEMPIPYSHSWAESPLSGFRAAAWIPTWEHPLHDSNLLSANGGRLFFNANDALVPRDANNAQDVYEWEAPGVGRCRESSPAFSASNGGCLYLISSGESSFESEFWEASPDGHDVFFTTESSLLPQDPGLIDLYDARVEGGFPQPTPIAPCEGEACQSPPPPPDFSTPASGSYHGPGNPPHRHKRHKKHKHKHRAGHKRRAAR